MLSDRVQRQVDRLLDQAEEAIALRQWEDLRATCETLLSLDPDNSDAARYLILANDSLATEVVSDSSDIVEPSEDPTPEAEADASPPDASQDAEPEDGLETNSSDSKTSGQRIRDLAVANSKLAREQERELREAALRGDSVQRVSQIKRQQARQASSPRSRNLDSHNARSPADHDDHDSNGRWSVTFIIRTAALILILGVGARLWWASGYPEIWVEWLFEGQGTRDNIANFALFEFWPSLDDDRWLGLRRVWSDLLKFGIGTLAFSIGISLFKQWVRIERQGE